MKRLTEDELFDEIAIAASEQFAKLLIWSNRLALNSGPRGRRGAEDLLAKIICDNLGTLIGMAAVNPEMMAESICIRLRAHDFKGDKTRFFGHSLGVVQDAPEIETPAAVAAVINIGPPKE